MLESWSDQWRLPLNSSKCDFSFFSTDPHQATFMPLLTLLDISLLQSHSQIPGYHLRPNPFLWGTCPIPMLQVLPKNIKLCAPLLPPSGIPPILYKAFVRPGLSYASPVWFTFPCTMLTTQLEILHRAACMVITGCLSFIPFPFLFLRPSFLPSKQVNSKHYPALNVFGTPSESRKKPFSRSYCLSPEEPLPS